MGNVHAGREAGLHRAGTVLPSDQGGTSDGPGTCWCGLPVLAAIEICPRAVVSGCPETASLVTERD